MFNIKCYEVRTLHSTPRTLRITLWAFCNTLMCPTQCPTCVSQWIVLSVMLPWSCTCGVMFPYQSWQKLFLQKLTEILRSSENKTTIAQTLKRPPPLCEGPTVIMHCDLRAWCGDLRLARNTIWHKHLNNVLPLCTQQKMKAQVCQVNLHQL